MYPQILAASLSVLTLVMAQNQGFAAPAPATPNGSNHSFCGTLVAFGGRVEVLDSSRNQLGNLSEKTAIPCGGWVSISRGWVEIRLRDGFRIFGSQGSFFQLPESLNEQNVNHGEQIVLYRGQIFAHASTGSGELRVITPNARGRFLRSKGIVLYNEQNEESQLIALEGSGSLENRFQVGRKILVKEGEASTLNFKALRVVPSTPRATSLVSIRGKLEKLQIEGPEKESLLRNVRARADRKFAIRLKPPIKGDARAPASVSGVIAPNQPETFTAKEAEPSNYARHKVQEDDSKLQTHLVNRLVSSREAGEKMLYPDQIYSRARSVKILVADPSGKKRRQHIKEDDEEKKRLIEALSEIRPD